MLLGFCFHAGLSENDLESELHDEIATLKIQVMPSGSTENPSLESKPSDDAKFEGETVSASIVGSSRFEELNHIVGSSIHSVPDECEQKEELEELKLDNLFSEDCSYGETLPSEALKRQKEKFVHLENCHILGNIDEIWKKEAQNKIAAFVLYQLFPNLPFAHLLIEPYASFIMERLKEDEFLERVEDNENNRRVEFVDSLLDGVSKPRAPKDVKDESISREMLADSPNKDVECNFLFENAKMTSLEGKLFFQSELFFNVIQLAQEREEMLETRAALPIAKLQDSLLQLFSDNDVIIVSGETGSGKTTQVERTSRRHQAWIKTDSIAAWRELSSGCPQLGR
ncbi:putative pre-mRNA-splicing factor ATP-dependent RNA helicase [Platanthera zijinensis]|uniref:Pre-mRNA-splicing factor ATP-dependent RNA helicase n=1 Tax=Platanthera zijinensis TaxID=2320716 RepID=A0AAP0GCB2_9ASPA